MPQGTYLTSDVPGGLPGSEFPPGVAVPMGPSGSAFMEDAFYDIAYWLQGLPDDTKQTAVSATENAWQTLGWQPNSAPDTHATPPDGYTLNLYVAGNPNLSCTSPNFPGGPQPTPSPSILGQ
ncbi:hypothetical protein ACIP5Y_25095 [Nocardia sp. NPDC088792]|uniref:hypothetical protein n=1 Tax=Nocardia sp. NPDC088792 TaxID=3364332 RepID=UPI00380574B9